MLCLLQFILSETVNGKGKMSSKICFSTKIIEFFYGRCATHSLNLIINDAVNVNAETISFFAIIQEIYNLSSFSYKRWVILLDFVKKFTIDGKVKLIQLKYQLGEIYDALFEILNNENFNKETKHETQTLCTKIKDYKLICFLMIYLTE